MRKRSGGGNWERTSVASWPVWVEAIVCDVVLGIGAGQAMTLAAIDRLVHHATILEVNVKSYCRKAALKRNRGQGIERYSRSRRLLSPAFRDRRQGSDFASLSGHSGSGSTSGRPVPVANDPKRTLLSRSNGRFRFFHPSQSSSATTVVQRRHIKHTIVDCNKNRPRRCRYENDLF